MRVIYIESALFQLAIGNIDAKLSLLLNII